MSKLDELKTALYEHAIIFNSSAAPLIQLEHSGETAAWLFDLRAQLLQPHYLDLFAEIFWEKYAPHYPFQVGGMESASIPLITAVVMKSVARGTPVNGFYIRKSRKREGRMRQIEGTLVQEKIILIDDLINSGNSFLKQIKILESEGKTVSEIFTIVRFRDHKEYTHVPVPIASLFTLADFGLNLEIPFVAAREPFEEVWKFSAPTPSRHVVVPKSAPVLDGSNVYMGFDDGVFRAFSQAKGALQWEFATGRNSSKKGILSTTALHHQSVFFGGYDGSVYALNAGTGEKKWEYADADWVGSSPALAPQLGLLFIGLEFGLLKKRGGIIALDIHTGKKKWSDTHAEFTHGSPLYIEEKNLVIIGSNDATVRAYDAATGEKKWSIHLLAPVKASFAFDPVSKSIFCGTVGGHAYAISSSDGLIVWIKELKAGMYSTPYVSGQSVFIGTLDKYMYALETASGKIQWEYKTGGRIFSSPAVLEQSLWVGSNDGILYDLHPETGVCKSTQQFSERIVNTVAYSPTAHMYYVTTQANELYCLKKR